MTVKKRLAISNIIMIAVPVVITLLVGALCLGGIYVTLHNSNGFGFESSGEFYDVSQAVSTEMYEIFEHGSEDTKSRLEAIGSVIDKNTTFVQVYENGEEFYTVGNESIADRGLMSSAKEIGSNAFVSSSENELYYYSDSVGDKNYELYLFSSNNHQNNTAVKNVFIISIIIIVLAILFSIIFTNKFLTKFIFKKIEEPLDILSHGVEEISNGNLDYRLNYNKNDEFLPVCTAFNDMALRLKKSVELAQKNKENRKELLLDISHDLRSPLTSIQAYVEGLIDGVADSPKMKEKYLQTIKRKTVDIEKMVSSLFAYSKLDMEEFVLNNEEIALPDFIEKTVENIKDEYSDKGLQIKVTALDKSSVIADRELLLRIMSNILDNSLKYSDKENAECEIIVSKNGEFTSLEFADNGCGVEKDKLEKLFEVFYRTDKARTNTGNGSGIGLAFVKKAAVAMGGDVKAQNNSKGGLSIIIYLRNEENE